MRHSRFQRINTLGVAVILAVTLAYSAGCATNATPARKQFTTISDAAEAVKTAMLVFNSQYQAGKATEQQRTQVLKTYAIYQTAALDGAAAARAGKPVDGLAMVNNAALPLLDLLASFGVKTP
jgi:hypothetical protein